MGRAAAWSLALVAGLCFVSCDFVKVRVIEKSMEPTIKSGQLVAIDSDAFDDRDPHLNEIVSLRPPKGSEGGVCGVPVAQGRPCPRAAPGRSGGPGLIKRVVARSGQRVAIDSDGALVLDGVRQEEPFTIPCQPQAGCALPRSITVPRDHLFVLGDNRPYSSDSRSWGPVPSEAIDGKVEISSEG